MVTTRAYGASAYGGHYHCRRMTRQESFRKLSQHALLGLDPPVEVLCLLALSGRLVTITPAWELGCPNSRPFLGIRGSRSSSRGNRKRPNFTTRIVGIIETKTAPARRTAGSTKPRPSSRTTSIDGS